MKDRIKEIRKDLKMTQPEFAAEIGKSRDVVATYESGRIIPDNSVLMLIELKYGYRSQWIRTGELPKKLPDPEGDGEASVALQAAWLDEAVVRAELKELLDRIPGPYLKLAYTILTAPDLLEPPTDPK